MKHINLKRRHVRRRRVGSRLRDVAFVVLIGSAPQIAVAQDAAPRTGAVSGVVYDSVSNAPLVNADVVVWNSALRTRTDSAGRFELTGVPSGAQDLVLLHDLLLSLGVSPGARRVTVVAGETSSVALATPSPFTILKNLCLLDGADQNSGVLVGAVGDAEQGVALPGAQVRLSWINESGQEQSEEAVADGMGWFRFCAVPDGVPAGLMAQYLNQTSQRVPIQLGGEDEAWVALEVGEALSGTVTGHLSDVDRNWAVEDAEISLVGTPFQTVSNSSGSFRFTRVPAGEYTLSVSHLAYGDRETVVTVEGGMSLSVEVPMSLEAIALDPIVVVGEPIVDLDGVVAGGRLIDAEAVEAVRHRATDVADLLRMMRLRDVIVRRDANGEVCVGVSAGQVRMMSRRNCTSMIVYVDNVRVSSPTTVFSMHPDGIDRMVVYRPVEAGNLFGLGAGNGVLMIYTRAGRRPRSP